MFFTMKFDSNFPTPLCLKHFLQCFLGFVFCIILEFVHIFNKILNKIYKSSHLHWYYFSELAFTFDRWTSSCDSRFESIKTFEVIIIILKAVFKDLRFEPIL